MASLKLHTVLYRIPLVFKKNYPVFNGCPHSPWWLLFNPSGPLTVAFSGNLKIFYFLFFADCFRWLFCFFCRCCDSGRGAGTSCRAPAHPGGQLPPLSVANPDPADLNPSSQIRDIAGPKCHGSGTLQRRVPYGFLYSPPVEGTVNSLEQKTRVFDVQEFHLWSRCSHSLAGRLEPGFSDAVSLVECKG